ncbi:MAG: NAD(P)H-dependent oxidoreductase [Pseudomonadales bacterium]|nr:NAD(P)H-dependent oxidoreductase [Pseudomonadales bacterium]
MKHLLIVYHSKNGSTSRMAEAVYRGATHPDIEVKVSVRPALQAGVDDLLSCDAIILGTPENLGYMSGGMKDFLDRTFYPAEGKIEGLPYAVFISAGNDGQGALTSLRRVVRGYPMKEACEPVIVKGELDSTGLEACENLGLYMAAGVESGIF